jgi:hypothetical protein
MADNKNEDNLPPPPKREILVEPFPGPLPSENRVIANDGLDNSDLKTLLHLARRSAEDEK